MQSQNSFEIRTRRRINYGAWLFKLIAWDSLLPAMVILVPAIANILFPNRGNAIEFMAVTLPIAAFFFRFAIAMRHINSNECSRIVRRIQVVFLCVAILVLLLIDSLFILALEMPQGALFATTTDITIWTALIAIYLTCMAVAMYPGYSERTIDPRDDEPIAAVGSSFDDP